MTINRLNFLVAVLHFLVNKWWWW